MERETLNSKELEELVTKGRITEDSEEDDKGDDGDTSTPLMTPIPAGVVLEKEGDPVPVLLEKKEKADSEDEEGSSLTEKAPEPKFNITK